MAKIQSESVVITFNKLVKDETDSLPSILTDDILTTLESVVQELAGPGVIVEIAGV